METFATQKKEPHPDASARKIFGLIGGELALVEAEFERQASSNIQVIDYLGEYLRASGGKRVRPALLILSNYAVGGNGQRESVIRLATVMEMLHTATLVHDDIIDNASVRRNRSSVNSRFGNQTAVLMGDWLYMSAFETTVGQRSLEILGILTRVTRKMTEGELIQLTTLGRVDLSETEYFDILKRKTAYLFSACCEIGAIVGGAGEAEQKAMRDYGMELGIAFQLSDDLLDLTGESSDLGKATGSDLLEGKMTLPLISLLQKNPALKAKFENVMLSGEYGSPNRDDLKEMLKTQGILDANRARARDHAERAIKSLDILNKSEYRSSLEDVLEFVIQRKH